MHNIKSTKELNEAITSLKEKQYVQGQLLKEQFHEDIERLKPLNILKTSINDMIKSPDLLNDMISMSVGLTAGYFTNKIFVGRSGSNLKKLFGNIMQLGITTIVVQNPGVIKSIGNRIFQLIFSRRNPKICEYFPELCNTLFFK